MTADRGPVTSVVTIIFATLAVVFVAARFFTRAVLLRSLKQDDWWILAAWVVAVGFSTSICVGVHYGLGLHGQDIGSVARHEALRKAEYAFSVLYNPSLLLTKTSIIVFFLSVMSKDVDPIFKWCNWLTLAIVNVGGVTLTFLNIFQCRPISSTFRYPTPDHAKCTDIVTLYLSSAPINIITDLAILFLPMPILTGMRLQQKQKIILIITFGCGAFVAAVDVVRIAYLQSASLNRLRAINSGSHPSQRIQEENDFSWYASFSFMWSAVEVNLSIICASVPTLKPLFMRFMPKVVADGKHETSPIASESGHHSTAPVELVLSNDKASFLNNPAAFHKPMVRDYADDEERDEMGFMDMLNYPERNSSAQLNKTTTAISKTTTHKTGEFGSDFGFVSMDRTRNMLNLSNRQSAWPIAVVILIFLLWGLAYGLLDTLNAKFEVVADIGTGQGLGLHASYFSGYFVGSLTLGQYMLRRYGFKVVMMAGLCVYGCGALTFWPSAVLTSYPAFMVSNFIVAFGLSCLEIAANPYVALCGPNEYAEVRLGFAQGIQAIGTITAPLLAQKVLFTDTRATALVDVQWTYLAIAFFVIGLAVVFYYIPLPEASDEQLQAMAEQRHSRNHVHIGPYRIVWWTLGLGVFSQWCYVGGQEVIRGTTQQMYKAINLGRPRPSTLTAFDYQTVCSTVYMTGRLLSALSCVFIPPRQVLLLLNTGLVACCIAQMLATGTGALVVNQLIYLFESGMFALIFAIGLRGMGRHTKMASSFMTAAISGGAIFPTVKWATANRYSLKISFVVPLAVFTAAWIFPAYLNLVSAARDQVDPKLIEPRNQAPEGDLMHNQDHDHDDPSTLINGLEQDSTVVPPKSQVKTLQAKGGGVQHVERQHHQQPPGLGPLELSSTPSSNLIKLRRPSGIIGELKPWPSSPASTPTFGPQLR